MLSIHSVRNGAFCLFCLLSCFWCVNAQADEALYVPRSYLELTPEIRLIAFQTNDNRTVQTSEMVIHFGLDWQRWRYVSIHGWLHAGCSLSLYDPYEYRYLNRQSHSQALALLGLQAIVDIHPQNRVVALNLALRADTAMVQGRVGIFTVETGFGVVARPFVHPRQYRLKTLSFGVMTWIPLLDDFETVFSLERKRFYLSLMAGFEF